MSALCLACGLCCDGSLFGFVPLEPAEVAPARRHGLTVVGNRGFEQPCTALHDGACAVYAARPAACRRFTCQLLSRGGPLEAVERVRALLRRVDTLDDAELGELRDRIERDFSRADQSCQ